MRGSAAHAPFSAADRMRKHTHTHTYTQTDIQAHTHTYTHTNRHSGTHAHVHTPAHSLILCTHLTSALWTGACWCVRACVFATNYTHANACTHMLFFYCCLSHTRTHTHGTSNAKNDRENVREGGSDGEREGEGCEWTVVAIESCCCASVCACVCFCVRACECV